MVSLMISYMNPSIESSFASIYTVIVSSRALDVKSGRYYYLGSKFLYVDWIYVAFHDVSIIGGNYPVFTVVMVIHHYVEII